MAVLMDLAEIGAYDDERTGLRGVNRLALNERGITTRRPIEVGIFTEEEGVRFGTDMLGSAVAARNYLYSLNGELADTGVHAGALTIGAMIARSEAASAATADAGAQFPIVDPDDLAQYYWDMYTKRDRVEQFYPESMTAQAAG
ncbi:hypothetical protein [Streptomyces sp. NPDC127197]|uniref:hypothetical protein n=1 Tax=Streptomyces sp. NPDC127197 TaxID=3345388 RepID=UPI0036355EFB